MPGRPRTRFRKLIEAETKLVAAILELLAQSPQKVQAGKYRDEPLGGIWRRVDADILGLATNLTALHELMADFYGLPDSSGDPFLPVWNRVQFRLHNGTEYDAGRPPLTEDEVFVRPSESSDAETDTWDISNEIACQDELRSSELERIA